MNLSYYSWKRNANCLVYEKGFQVQVGATRQAWSYTVVSLPFFHLADEGDVMWSTRVWYSSNWYILCDVWAVKVELSFLQYSRRTRSSDFAVTPPHSLLVHCQFRYVYCRPKLVGCTLDSYIPTVLVQMMQCLDSWLCLDYHGTSRGRVDFKSLKVIEAGHLRVNHLWARTSISSRTPWR